MNVTDMTCVPYTGVGNACFLFLHCMVGRNLGWAQFKNCLATPSRERARFSVYVLHSVNVCICLYLSHFFLFIPLCWYVLAVRTTIHTRTCSSANIIGQCWIREKDRQQTDGSLLGGNDISFVDFKNSTTR